MKIDVSKYQSYLDGFDLTDEQKLELMHQVWFIMSSFVDIAFGVAPEQQLSSGKGNEQRRRLGIVAIGLKDTLTPIFNTVADEDAARK